MTTATPVIYTKLSAQGNVFCVLDATLGPMHWHDTLDAETVRRWSNHQGPRFFDQLLVVSAAPDDACHVHPITIYNADGSTAEQCGNGMRALAFWLLLKSPQAPITEHVLKPVAGAVKIRQIKPHATHDGHHPTSAWVEVALPGPRIGRTHTGWPATPASQAIEVSMGNPHLVLVWPQAPSAAICQSIGSDLQQHPAFFGGINVNFAHPTDSGIALRVYERGVGPTEACGSGACATAAALIARGLASSPVGIDQPGGRLVVNWSPEQSANDEIVLAGDVDWIEQGQWTL